MLPAFRVYVGLGSNIDQPALQVGIAARYLASVLLSPRTSSLYLSRPVGDSKQPDFVNAVASGDCRLSPFQLLHYLKHVERAMGRMPSRRWGPRRIDLDLLRYGDETIDTDSLRVPHAEMQKRAFVLGPLLELFGDSEFASRTNMGHNEVTRMMAEQGVLRLGVSP